jgi:hypothetical protein
MSTVKSFVEKSIRPVLLATAVGTLPALVFLSFGVIASLSPPEPLDPDPDIAIPILVSFALFSAVATFVVSSLIAVTWHVVGQKLKRRELRRIGERFGWAPQK